MIESLDNSAESILVFRQLKGGQGLIQPYSSMTDEFGRKFNSEAKTLIKLAKEKQ